MSSQRDLHLFPLYPGLTSWAKLFRRSAAGLRWISVHSSPRNPVLTQSLKPALGLALFGGPEGPVFHVHAARPQDNVDLSNADDHHFGGFDQGGDGLTLFQPHFAHGAGRDQGSDQLPSHR